MPKETQKAKIERLEKELWDCKILNSKLQQEIIEFQDNAEIGFLNSPSFTQMQKTINQLTQEKKILEINLKVTKETNTELRKQLENTRCSTVKNERGAGRKALFSEEDKKQVKWYREKGKTIKEISELYCCSVGLIHKIINENN